MASTSRFVIMLLALLAMFMSIIYVCVLAKSTQEILASFTVLVVSFTAGLIASKEDI